MPPFSLPGCGRQGAFPPPPAPPASGKVPVPHTGRSRTRLRSADTRRKSRKNANGSSRFSAERPIRVFAPLRRLPSGAETLLRSGDWLMDDCLMVVWYGERRGFPSRFLSPEPLSGQPGANKGRMVYLTSFHDEELDQGKIQPPGPPVHLPVKKVFHLVSFLNFSARNSLFSPPDILWRKKSILAIDILYELVRF